MNKKRHLDALSHFRIANRNLHNQLKNYVNLSELLKKAMRQYKYDSTNINQFIDGGFSYAHLYRCAFRTESFLQNEIEKFLEEAANDWKGIRDCLQKEQWATERVKCELSHAKHREEELQSKNTEYLKEIERLKEVIACVSSRVIEIVEKEKK